MDQFDRIQDSVLLLIFNRIGDFKTLCRCCAVSRRFNDQVTQVDNVVLKVDTRIMESAVGFYQTSLLSLIRAIIIRILIPLRHLFSLVGTGPLSNPNPWARCTPVLKNFKEIRVLKIDIPSGCLGRIDKDKGEILKWKAEIGPSFRKCVVLAASSSSTVGPVCSNEGRPVTFVKFGISPLRVPEKQLLLFKIGSVVEQFALAAREYLLEIIDENTKLDTFVLTDVDRGGVLCMTRLQKLAVSSKMMISVPALYRTRRADEVSLTNGVMMKKVVLAVVWPKEQSATCDLANTFEEPYESCLRMLIPMWSDGLLYTRPFC